MRTLAAIITLVTLFPSAGYSARRSKYFAFYGQHHSYSDITSSGSSSDRKTLSNDYSLNLDIRMIRIFILTLHGGQSFDSSRKHAGLGFKVDLPGFFMLGGNINDLIRRKKRKGINTSIHWKTYVIQDTSQEGKYVGNRFSFSADIKFTDSLFLNLDLGLYSHRGDQYLSPTFGLGFEF
jgi:hypothetical protein